MPLTEGAVARFGGSEFEIYNNHTERTVIAQIMHAYLKEGTVLIMRLQNDSGVAVHTVDLLSPHTQVELSGNQIVIKDIFADEVIKIKMAEGIHRYAYA